MMIDELAIIALHAGIIWFGSVTSLKPNAIMCLHWCRQLVTLLRHSRYTYVRVHLRTPIT